MACMVDIPTFEVGLGCCEWLSLSMVYAIEKHSQL